ncbi:hypothetical protein NliqN6_1164 [Naganishia liquefaciens]|uniref:Uncharacterized protein n=1 Tax=Naganishia liquefaciens TaxID=104408 RepID=A0A8H3YDZ7_9TREE|nr:hypothetical protein NliqN6_1164 [Naganishia liquefaciens]
MGSIKRKLKSLLPTGRTAALRNVLTIEWNGTSTPLWASPRSSREEEAAGAAWRRVDDHEDEDEEVQPLTSDRHEAR